MDTALCFKGDARYRREIVAGNNFREYVFSLAANNDVKFRLRKGFLRE